MLDYKIQQYRKWQTENVTHFEAYSPDSLRILVHHMLMGRNYRLITEHNTKDRLLLTYIWINDIVKQAKIEFGSKWREELLGELINMKKKTAEQTNLMKWLLGLTGKTFDNMGLHVLELPDTMNLLQQHVEQLFTSIKRKKEIDKSWIFLMAGSATLFIRGSEKSVNGKKIEKVLIRALLSLLGLKEGVHFWLNINRDKEVERETDAEILTKRGKIRLELGLIAPGNQEVVEDKISRVDKNGIIMFDKAGAKTRIYETASIKNVKLIQIRNNQPLVEVYRHLKDIVDYKLIKPAETEDTLHDLIYALPDSIFTT